MSRSNFDTDAKYREQLFKELIEIVGELGWAISFSASEEEVDGMIIGTQGYIDSMLGDA